MSGPSRSSQGRERRLTPALIRQFNAARIFHAVRLAPGASQRDLHEDTGLDKATISTVVRQLEEDGLLVRRPRPAKGVGRPDSALDVVRDGAVLVGVRLEPGSVRAMAATLTGEALHTLQVPGAKDVDEALERCVALVGRLLAEADLEPDAVRAVGVGVPALFDANGALTYAPNFGWRDVPVRERLQTALPMPVYVDNDTKAAGLAEKLFGSCRDVQDFLFVAGHSGLGGALYLNGRLYRGTSGYAGEVGHLRVRPGGRWCACGGQGCLEAYLSEAALLAQAAERGVPVDTLEGLAAAAQEGGEACALLTEAGEVLGDACGNLVNLFDPQRIVLGGNLATVAGAMMPAVERRLAEIALAPPARDCRVTVSPFGVEAVTMGGVSLALEGFLSLPHWLVASELGPAR